MVSNTSKLSKNGNLQKEDLQIEALDGLLNWSRWLVTIQSALITFFIAFMKVDTLFASSFNNPFFLIPLGIAPVFFFLSIGFGSMLIGRIPNAVQAVPIKPDVHSFRLSDRKLSSIFIQPLKSIFNPKLLKKRTQLRHLASWQHRFFYYGLSCLLLSFITWFWGSFGSH